LVFENCKLTGLTFIDSHLKDIKVISSVGLYLNVAGTNINNIEIESYIAGVVQAETWGATTNVEFFKLQAICVRNYLMMNISKL
jgi:peptidoglycan hydrolase-like amidase